MTRPWLLARSSGGKVRVSCAAGGSSCWWWAVVSRSGNFPAAVTDGRHDVNGATEGADVGADDVDSGDVTMLDLGDPGLGDAQGVGEFGLGHARGLAHLGKLVAADERFAAFTGSGLTGGALGVGTGVELSRLGLDVGPPGVFGAHRSSSSSSAIRCSAYRSSASGIALFDLAGTDRDG